MTIFKSEDGKIKVINIDSSPHTQKNLFFTIATPLGDDVLFLTGFSGTEGLSTPFSFELDLASKNPALNFKDIVGKNVTVSITLSDGESRFINGIISRFSQVEYTGVIDPAINLTAYNATLVPWTWFLTRIVDSRIFQNLTVPKIVEKLLNDAGFGDFEMRLAGDYSQWEYCVQYHETDFHFITRLFEQEGIFYFFEHENGKHKLILADTPQEHKPCPHQEFIRCQLTSGAILEKEDVITSLGWMQEIRFGKYTSRDYNFLTPAANLQIEVPTRIALGPGEREMYEYPGEYEKRKEGEQYANIRMQAEEAQITTLSGSSNCRSLVSGYRFTLKDFSRKDMNDKPYTLTSVWHSATEAIGLSGDKSKSSYTNKFTCIPQDVPYRPPLATQRPVITGVQTAVVTGPSGEEIYTDKHGRVKVQFHWDREGKMDDKTSCWIRVMQSWSGVGWGAVWIPRIGQEVVVSFIEGDPDRPLITGSVYNASNTPPYPLPNEMTKSTIKSNSTKGGGGFNEIRFEDKKGEEQLFIQAEKNLDLRVKNDRFETINHDHHLTVENDIVEHAKNERHVTVDMDHFESIGKDRHLDIKGKEAKQVAQSLSLTVQGDMIEVFKAAHSEQATGDYYLRAQNVVIEAMQNITLTVGGNYIAISSMGIGIKTDGLMKIESSSPMELKSPMITVSGDGVVTIKGGLVKIN